MWDFLYDLLLKVKFLDHRVKVPPIFPLIIRLLCPVDQLQKWLQFSSPWVHVLRNVILQLLLSRDRIYSRIPGLVTCSGPQNSEGYTPVPSLGLERPWDFHFFSQNSTTAIWSPKGWKDQSQLRISQSSLQPANLQLRQPSQDQHSCLSDAETAVDSWVVQLTQEADSWACEQ